MLSSRHTDVAPAFPSLSSRQDPVVQRFRHLARDPASHGGILLDGAHLIREACDAGLTIDIILVAPHFFERASPEDAALPDHAARSGVRVFSASTRVIDAASPVRTSSGIVAIAAWTLRAVGDVFVPAPALAVGLVEVQDPGNVGAAIRSADALGATGVIALEGTAHPAGWKALRGAMGSTFRLPVCRAGWDEVGNEARRTRTSILAAVAEQAEPVTQLDLRRPTLLLVGNEGAGLPRYIIDASDARVTVPMRPGVSSLNVSVTVGLILYEARRQRELRIP
jgi:RNA methyltransferase, TrmH family